MEFSNKLVYEIINRYKNEDLPCLSDTLVKLSRLNPEFDSAFEELSSIILEDMGLTGKVIRTVNSVYYRRSGQEITTVTQALVLLGFETVRKIALNMAVLDLAEKNADEPLSYLILASFTAAFLAQDIIESGDRQECPGESIFVSSLFHCLGRIILCLHRPETYQALSAREFEEEEAGAVLTALSMGLGQGFAELWGLPQAIVDSMEGMHGGNDTYTRIIEMCHLAVRAAISDNGLGALAGALKQISQETPYSSKEISERMNRALQSSLELSQGFRAIISPARLRTVLENLDHPAGLHGVEPVACPNSEGSGDDSRFLKLVTHLTSTMARQEFRLEEVYLFAAEALLRGVDMERVILALLTVERNSIRPRYVIGKHSKGIKEGLSIAFPPGNHSVSETFSTNSIGVFPWKFLLEGCLDYMVRPELQVCLAPIVVQERPVGCFLVDCPVCQRHLLPADILKVRTIRDLVVLATLNR